MFSSVFVIVLGMVGFAVAAMIRHKKKIGQPLVCPMDANCEAVVHSSHSKFFGIDVANLGLIYYGFIVIFYTLALAARDYLPQWFFVVGFLITLLAVVFSIYLIIVQFLVLKDWCFWCLVSAVVSMTILIAVGYAMGQTLYFFLAEYKTLIVVLHALSATLGVGTVLVTDIFFMKFLKDFQITESEADILDTLSQIVWFALALLIITGVALYLPTSAEYLAKTKFVAKVVVVGVVVINGVLLNLLVAPKLIKISFRQGPVDNVHDFHNLRRFAFAFGGVSIVSWLATFILGSIRSLPMSVGEILLVYLALVIGAVAMSQYMDYRYVHPKHEQMM